MGTAITSFGWRSNGGGRAVARLEWSNPPGDGGKFVIGEIKVSEGRVITIEASLCYDSNHEEAARRHDALVDLTPC